MRTFIDGVPAPEETTKKTAVIKSKDKETATPKEKTEVIQQKEPTSFFHPPFLEKQCDSCHDTKFSQKLVSEPKKLCFSCHDDFTKNKKIVHYPVSEGSCMECHDPHQSSNKSLLKKPIPEICLTCHDEKDIKANPAHEGQKVCTECHNPHSSNEEKLLK